MKIEFLLSNVNYFEPSFISVSFKTMRFFNISCTTKILKLSFHKAHIHAKFMKVAGAFSALEFKI